MTTFSYQVENKKSKLLGYKIDTNETLNFERDRYRDQSQSKILNETDTETGPSLGY